MFRLIAVLVLSLFMIVPGFAQKEAASTWCLEFAIVEAELPSSASGKWPADARNWWEKDGKHKFRELCEVDRQDAGLLLVWERKWMTETISRPITEPMAPIIFDLPRLEWDCSMDPIRQERCVQRLIRPEIKPIRWEDRVETWERVSVTVNRVQAGSLVPMKTITKKGENSGKKSIDSALKFLRKEARKFRASNAGP